jgi:hypothetical protein
MEPIKDAFRRLIQLGHAAKERALPVWKSAQLRFEPVLQWLKARPRVVFWAGGIGIALVLVLLGWAVGRMPVRDAWHWYGRNREDLAPLLTLFGSLVVGLGTITVGGLVARAALRQARTATQVAEIANRQAEIAGRRHEEQTRADQQRRITESFAKAVEQLGSDKLEVRLGGIYSLERISKESPDDYWTVMENLTAFVRERSRRNEAERTSQDLEQRVSRRAYFLWVEAGQPDGQADDFWSEAAKQEELGEPPATDIAGVLTVITRRSEQSRGREGANRWRFDLSGAILNQADLNFADLERAVLVRAHLERARLRAAHLDGAHLDDAHLEGADLIGAHLEGATLFEAHLERARLAVAHLEGANLIGAHLEGAFLSGAHLEGARFSPPRTFGADSRVVLAATGLSESQLRHAHGDAATILPEGVARPAHWPDPAPDPH